MDYNKILGALLIIEYYKIINIFYFVVMEFLFIFILAEDKRNISRASLTLQEQKSSMLPRLKSNHAFNLRTKRKEYLWKYLKCLILK